MINTPFLVAFIIGVFGTLAHGVFGHIYFVRRSRRAPFEATSPPAITRFLGDDHGTFSPDQQRRYLTVGWHLFTVSSVFSTVVFGLIAFGVLSNSQVVAYGLAIHWAMFAVCWLVCVVAPHLPNLWHAPQWILMVILASLAWWGGSSGV